MDPSQMWSSSFCVCAERNEGTYALEISHTTRGAEKQGKFSRPLKKCPCLTTSGKRGENGLERSCLGSGGLTIYSIETKVSSLAGSGYPGSGGRFCPAPVPCPVAYLFDLTAPGGRCDAELPCASEGFARLRFEIEPVKGWTMEAQKKERTVPSTLRNKRLSRREALYFLRSCTVQGNPWEAGKKAKGKARL